MCSKEKKNSTLPPKLYRENLNLKYKLVEHKVYNHLFSVIYFYYFDP